MKNSDLLMIPGPTPLPDRVREAMSRPAIAHRGAEFKDVLKRVLPKLRWAFQTQSDVLLYTASGTGAMEAALVNTLNPGDLVLCLSCGVFSERWADIAKTLGLEVERQEVPHGQPNSIEPLRERLAADTNKKIKAVMLTHSETSTGVLNPIREMVALIRQHGALSIVDAVTSLGSAEFRFDDWGVDLAVSGSQKGFMIPPGLSFLAVGPRAWEAHAACRNPGFYFNFKRYKKAQDEFTTPYTPATHLILALEAALEMMEAEGLETIVQRHRKLRDMTRAGVAALGLSAFVEDPAFASLAVTSALPPNGLSVSDLRASLKNRFGIVVADGQKDLKGKIFRVGHLGYVSERDTLTVLAALESVLIAAGVSVTPGAAVGAAQSVAIGAAEKRKAGAHA